MTAADVLTWSRVAAAGWLCGFAAQPRPERRTVAWLILLWGATASDWLDGPLARRFGPTRLGAVLDLEADSWLTLWAAASAWRAGVLPPACLVAPLLRYVVRWRRGIATPMATAAWQRAAGAAQMMVLAGALAPARPVRFLARRLLVFAMVGQLMALGVDAVTGARASHLRRANERRSAPPIQASARP